MGKKDEIAAEAATAKKTLVLLTKDAFSLAFDRNRSSLLENAAITPYETRELLKSYLDSLSSRFKVGLLFGAKKTAEEREKRKEAFATNINKLVHTQIAVHLKTLMKKSMKDAGILTDERSLEVDSLDVTIPFSVLEKQFNVSDVITGETILNASNQMKVAITNAFRRITDDWKTEMSRIASTAGNEIEALEKGAITG